jgi:hypothetical protein
MKGNKSVMEGKKIKQAHSVDVAPEIENLGLDADGSSDESSLKTRFNDDNDRISGNQDGENDVENGEKVPYSPLGDK